jgi:hypothetical protein
MTTGNGTRSDAGGQPISIAGRAPDGGPSGTNCFEDLRARTILCGQIDTCPGVDVDPTLFPDCGFRMHAGSLLDLECLCGDAMCPVGVATDCNQAKQLLAMQNAFVVCLQQAEGRCVQIVTPNADAGRACDTTCRSGCAGSPSCLQLCGC